MNPEEIKETIESEIVKTRKYIEELRDATKPITPDVAYGRVSRMDAINNKSVAEASLRQAEGKLKNLERVLSRFGTPDFGICVKCKKPIPVGRILIRPQSLLCVNCAQ
ncbi:MAG: TraR/DksA C4-type zinc finger protein [Cryomorphaceae bacterium]|nr:TraR/DksA C4-type zinc finger protein [Cryomorphaceae bacterium]